MAKELMVKLAWAAFKADPTPNGYARLVRTLQGVKSL